MHRVYCEPLESRALFSAALLPAGPYGSMEPAAATVVPAAARAVRSPVGMLSAKAITSPLTSYTFRVTYHSSALIDATTIATGNVTVNGPNGFAQTAALVSMSPAGNSRRIVAVYSMTAPSGAVFTPNDNGKYTVTLAAGSVADVNHVAAAAPKALGGFSVHLKVVPSPTASLSAGAVSSAAASYSFTVTYRSSIPVSVSSIATGSVSVSGPHGYSGTATLSSVTPSKNSKSILATYAISPPSGGAFGPSDNGTYTVTLAAGLVKTVTGGTNLQALTLGTFAVSVPTTPPPAALPNMLGTYNGTTYVPNVSPLRSVVLTVASEDASGNFSGNWVTDAGVTFDFTGTVAADGSFTYSFSTAPNTYHATGPVTGSGTGTGGGTSSLSFKFSATSAGFTAPGTMSVTKA